MSTRVLVIDDEESVAVTLAGILQQAGYQTDQAANLDEAVALIESKPFDAILLDLHLGGDDGLAVLDRVWATSPDTVAIVLTGYGTLESASRAMRLGVSEYLFKPCPVDELKSALRRGLDRRAAILATRQAVADERARLLAAEGQARREAEEARARAEAAWRQLHDLFMQAPAAIALTRGPDHVFELVNPIFLRMVGRGQPSDLLGKPAAEALPEIVEQGFVALADRVYTSGQPFAAREVPGRVARRADGALDEGYFDVVLQPYRDLHGQVAGIVQFDLDVTKQVRARQRAEQLAEQLVAERAQLARALERFQATFEQAAVGIAHVALDGRWLLVNEKMCAILGYPRAELLAGTFQDVTHPDDLEADLGLVARLLAGEIPNYCLEKRYLRPDGSIVWANLTVALVRDATGAPSYFISVVEDIGERKRLDAATREAVRVRDEFLGLAAHELKTPLTGLRASAQLLARQLDRAEPVDPERLRRRLAIVDAQSAKLALLIDQLLDVSRLETGHLALAPAPTDLVALVEAVAAGAQARTENHRITVWALGPTFAMVDPLRLEQVVANLVDNAIKFSPEGGPVELTVARPSRDEVEVAVVDRGIGVPPEHRARIFDRFFQAHGDRNYGGMGLGLYLSRQIVELHGGTLEAQFPPEGGARFVARLPAGHGQSPAEGLSC